MGKKGLVAVIFLVLASVLVSSCSSQPAAPATTGPGGKAPTRVLISAGSVAGTTTLMSNALAGIMKKFMGIDSTVLNYTTRMRDVAVARKETNLTVTNRQMVTDVWNGTWEANKQNTPAHDLREILPTDLQPIQIWVKADSPYKTFRDLIGKRVGPGTKAMSSWDILNRSASAMGYKYDDLNPQYLGTDESAQALVAGKIDAFINTGSVPQPTVAQYDITSPLRLIGFTQQDAEAICKAVPGLAVMTIPAKYYHMDVPVITPVGISCAVTLSSFSDDIVYNLVKYTMQNPDYAGYYFAGLKTFLTDQENGAKKWVETYPAGSPLPFHAGAVKAFNELGWKVPPERIPPEFKK